MLTGLSCYLERPNYLTCTSRMMFDQLTHPAFCRCFFHCVTMKLFTFLFFSSLWFLLYLLSLSPVHLYLPLYFGPSSGRAPRWRRQSIVCTSLRIFVQTKISTITDSVVGKFVIVTAEFLSSILSGHNLYLYTKITKMWSLWNSLSTSFAPNDETFHDLACFVLPQNVKLIHLMSHHWLNKQPWSLLRTFMCSRQSSFLI